MSLLSLVRPELADMRPYQAAEQVSDTVRLNANESPWPTAVDLFRRPLNRYPEIRPQRLRERLADRFGCQADELLVTRGSSEAIDLLIRVFCREGKDSIAITSPTFSMYAHYAAIQGAPVRPVELDPDADFALDKAKVLAAVDDTTKLLFLCSPNNPTGTSIPRQMLVELLDATRGRCGVVVDEAYIEFSAERSIIELLGDYEHLIVLRTLSKALGFAGARCGALIARRELLGVIDAVQAPYAVSTPVVECVEDALDSPDSLVADQRVAELSAERERIAAALATYPNVTKIWPSDANFLLVAIDDVDRVQALASDAKLLLRRFGGTLDGCLRISVGTPEENDLMLDLIRAAGEPS